MIEWRVLILSKLSLCLLFGINFYEYSWRSDTAVSNNDDHKHRPSHCGHGLQDHIAPEEDQPPRRRPPPAAQPWRFSLDFHHTVAHVSSGVQNGRLMRRSEKPTTCASLAVGSNVVDAFPGPSLVLRLNPTLTLDPSPAMLSMVHDYNLATGTNHEGRKP